MNTLNWEYSGENKQTFNNPAFYGQVAAGNLSQSQLNADVVSDIYFDSSPVIAITDTGYLPSWSVGGIIHAIAIIGYNNVSQTYTYVETCGSDGCGSIGQGVYTISQSALYNGIENASGNGALVW